MDLSREHISNMREVLSFPGHTIWETMKHRGISERELAGALTESVENVQLLLLGKKELSVHMAFNLEKVLGIDRSFWLRREALYRQNLALLEEYESQLPPRWEDLVNKI